MTGFQIEIAAQARSLTLKLAGELDSATCGILVSRFEEMSGDPEVNEVVLDLAGLSFIDSAGMRSVIVVQRRAQQSRIRLTVVPPPQALLDLLTVIGLRRRLNLVGEGRQGAPAGFLERIELELPADPSAPAAARAEVRESTTQARFTEFGLGTALLLTSELVTNAVVHPRVDHGAAVGLRIFKYEDGIRVEVTDHGTGFDPADPPPTDDPSGGRGLLVVDHSATRWGAGPTSSDEGRRFTVWFELHTAAEDRGGERARERMLPAWSQPAAIVPLSR